MNLHTYVISLFYILQNDITHACYIDAIVIDAIVKEKFTVMHLKEMLNNVKKNNNNNNL